MVQFQLFLLLVLLVVAQELMEHQVPMVVLEVVQQHIKLDMVQEILLQPVPLKDKMEDKDHLVHPLMVPEVVEVLVQLVQMVQVRQPVQVASVHIYQKHL